MGGGGVVESGSPPPPASEGSPESPPPGVAAGELLELHASDRLAYPTRRNRRPIRWMTIGEDLRFPAIAARAAEHKRTATSRRLISVQAGMMYREGKLWPA
jgi:hypothetical protein